MESTYPVSRSVITPQSCKFSGIGKVKGFNFDGPFWVPMKELDQAITVSLQKQGYDGERFRFIPQYDSFHLQPFFGYTKQTFPWLIEVAEKEMAPDVHYLTTCPFKREGLYVLERWARGVLNLTRKGIVYFEQRKNALPTGVCWKGNRFAPPDLSYILLKE